MRPRLFEASTAADSAQLFPNEGGCEERVQWSNGAATINGVSRRKAFWRVLVVTVFLSGAAGTIGANASWQRMEGTDGECARIYEESKTELVGYHWDWLPPAWVCEFKGRAGIPSQRRLPFGQR